ncbi:hypothetical protein [Salmonella enterica]|uniref:PFGI-1 class ICE element type IV pilus protein PilL2 n=1 Tax=Salmonella enterica TaxID=28901 RepID=UPI003D3186A2
MFTINSCTFFCPGLLLVLAGCAQSPATSSARDAAFSHSLKPASPVDIWQRSPEVTREGRYTLVSVKSADAQREPLNQLIDITMPVSLVSSVGDGFRYLLFQSGYSLCGRYGAEFAELLNRPLPAVQRRLGPVRLKAQVTQLVKDSEQVRADVTALATQQDALKQLTDTLSSRLDEQASRIGALSEWKTQREEKATGTATKPSLKVSRESAATSAPVKTPVVSRALTPPFVLTGVERRGGQAYAVVLPAGAGSDWSQLHMLVPGESYRGWTLVSTDGNRAAFQVNGRIQQLMP